MNSQLLYYRQEVREKTKYNNLLESVNVMTINVSMNTKTLSIDVFTSINFDDVDFDKNMIFIWLNDVIAGSVVIPIDEDIFIDFWIDKREYKSFNNYEEFRKFYNEYKNKERN